MRTCLLVIKDPPHNHLGLFGLFEFLYPSATIQGNSPKLASTPPTTLVFDMLVYPQSGALGRLYPLKLLSVVACGEGSGKATKGREVSGGVCDVERESGKATMGRDVEACRPRPPDSTIGQQTRGSRPL